MKKTFIERLTNEQIMHFLEKEYPEEKRYSCSFDRSKNFIYVRINTKSGHSSLHFSLYDFETIGFPRDFRWINYLYGIFGEEYKKAYLDDCAKVFN